MERAIEKASERVKELAVKAVETLGQALDEAEDWRDRVAAAKELTRLAGLRPAEAVEVHHYAHLTVDQLRAEAAKALAKLGRPGRGNGSHGEAIYPLPAGSSEPAPAELVGEAVEEPQKNLEAGGDRAYWPKCVPRVDKAEADEHDGAEADSEMA